MYSRGKESEGGIYTWSKSINIGKRCSNDRSRNYFRECDSGSNPDWHCFFGDWIYRKGEEKRAGLYRLPECLKMRQTLFMWEIAGLCRQ